MEENLAKDSKWAQLARKGHEMAWEMAQVGGSYTGNMVIDGVVCTTSEATKTFLQNKKPE